MASEGPSVPREQVPAMPPPPSPKVYHITHVNNLAGIVAEGGLLSDAELQRRQRSLTAIGMSKIKRRRLDHLEVTCHPGTKVGEYVPFYFCPRPVMLYIIHKANHPELSYRGGQAPIIYLQADLRHVVQWAEENGVRWAFSLSNAGASYTEFRNRLDQLDQLNWHAIRARDFRNPDVKEAKQAEFLVYGQVPFQLVERIGVKNKTVLDQVSRILSGAPWNPLVSIRPGWYF